MAFLDEQGLQHLVDKINVRSSKTLPDNAPDGTIIIDPDECSEGFNVSIDVDTKLSSTSTNPVQNKVIKTAIDTISANIPTKVSVLENDANYLTQHQSLEGYVKTSVVNTWTAKQVFDKLGIKIEKYIACNANGSAAIPMASVGFYNATGAFTLNMTDISRNLGYGESTVFTAYITSSAAYTLTITNAGTIKYVGSASDVAITNTGLLLNIMMVKDESGNLTSIVQANKLTS